MEVGQTMISSKKHNERLVILALAGILTLNYPLLSLFSKHNLLFGTPILYLYLFLAWGVLIGFMAWIMRHKVSGRQISEDQEPKTGG